jgi:hypothetical protein
MGRHISIDVAVFGYPDRRASLQLDLAVRRWTKFEPDGASQVFATPAGSVEPTGPDALLSNGRKRVAVLCGMDLQIVAAGDQGGGYEDELGHSLSWACTFAHDEADFS